MSSWDEEIITGDNTGPQTVTENINTIPTVPSTTNSRSVVKNRLLRAIPFIIVGCLVAATGGILAAVISTKNFATTATAIPQSSSSTIITTNTYGTLINTGANDNDNGVVHFHTADVIIAATGVIISSYVQQISISFATAPSTMTPTIWLYVLNATTSSVVFAPHFIYQVPYVLITTGLTGNQTMVLPANAVPISPGQYLAYGLGTGGGSAYTVSGRAQYYTIPSSLSSLSSTTYSSVTSGFAFSFIVRTTTTISG